MTLRWIINKNWSTAVPLWACCTDSNSKTGLIVGKLVNPLQFSLLSVESTQQTRLAGRDASRQ